MTASSSPPSLAMLLRALKLPTVSRPTDEIAQPAAREGWTFERYLHHLIELERDARWYDVHDVERDLVEYIDGFYNAR